MHTNQSRGFTLIEMMVAMGILTFVVAGVTQSFVVQNRAYTVVDQTTEAQQNLRAIAHLLEQDVRMTGFMVPEGAVACGVDSNAAPDTLYLTDPDPIDPTGQASATLGVQAPGYTANVTSQTLTLSAITLDGVGFYDTDGNGAGDSDFRDGGAVIVVDRGNPARGTACGTIENLQLLPPRLTVDFETALAAGTNANVVVIPARRYAVDANGSLTRDGTPIVPDVDDFQVAYFVDANDDGNVDANEYLSSAGSTVYTSASNDHALLREIRINLVLRSRFADPEYTEGSPQARENRVPAAVADGFRRRVLTTTVKPRNVGFRGTEVSG